MGDARVVEDTSRKMEATMRVTSRTTWPTAMASTSTAQATDMKDSGKTISPMARAKHSTLTRVDTMVNF